MAVATTPVKTQDDYAKDLAGLKSSYMNATTDQAKSAAQQQGADLRSQAAGQGINLNALEDSANKVGGIQTGPDESAFRAQAFGQVKPRNVPTETKPATTTADTGAGTEKQPMRFSNEYLEQANKLITQLGQIATQQKTFDPTTNATYQSAQQLAGDAAKLAQRSTLETMNDRGIINSSVTGSQLDQVAQRAQLEPLKLIPQLEQNFNQQQQQQFSNLSSVAGTMLNTGLDQQKFAAQLPMQEAALTGHHLPGDAQGLIQNLLSLKQSAEKQGVTPEQMAGYKGQADAIRNKLATFGVDANKLFGTDQNYAQASANVPQAGQLTADSQKSLASTLLGLSESYGGIQKGTGAELGQLPLFSGLADAVTGLEGKNNLKYNAAVFDRAYKTQRLNLQEERIQVSKDSAANSNAVAWANTNLNKQRLEQDKSKIDLDNNSKQATNGYLSQLLSMGSREDAMNYIVSHAPDIIKDNAHIDSILNSIDAKWPKPTNSSVNGKPIDMVAINKAALTAAEGDTVRWAKTAKDPKARKDLIDEHKAYLLQGTE